MSAIEQAEKQFAAHFGMKYGVMMCNGTATLHCCLLAAGVRPGDEVIVPALTMASPALAVRYCGAKSIYADICHDTFLMNVHDAERKITQRTKAIIVVSLYGYPFSWDSDLYRKCLIVDDAAECITPTCYAKMTSFSFQQTKHISCGEGGMVLTNDELLARKLRMYSNLGYSDPIDKEWLLRPDSLRHNLIGYNYRASNAQARLLLDEIPHIHERVNQRQAVAKLYGDAIEGTKILRPQKTESAYHCYWTWAAVLCEGASWSDFVHLFRANGGDRVYGAWRLPYQEPALYDDTQHCPVAERIQPRLLQFKTNYTDMDEAKRQADALHKTVKEYNP